MKIRFPLVSQGPASESADILPSGFTTSQIWTVVWERDSWFSNRLQGAAFGEFLILNCLCLPSTPSPKGNCTGQVQLVERSQKSHFLLLKDALHVTSCPEVTTLATALAQL